MGPVPGFGGVLDGLPAQDYGAYIAPTYGGIPRWPLPEIGNGPEGDKMLSLEDLTNLQSMKSSQARTATGAAHQEAMKNRISRKAQKKENK